MEFTSPPADDNNTDSSAVSVFLPTVVLQEWWLIKTDDDFQRKRLGVAGFNCRDQQAVRRFSSAPILESSDVCTLETVDGITILLKGLMNKDFTKQSGFPAEVFKYFVFGFPCFWKDYIKKFLEGECNDKDVSRSIADPEKLSTDSGGTPNRKRKIRRNSRATNCYKSDLLGAVKQSSNLNTKKVLRSCSRHPDANQCLDSFQECTPNKERKLIAKSMVANCDDKDSNQSGGDRNITKRVLRSCSRFSDVNQNGCFHTEDRSGKSNAWEEGSNSKEKTRRKLNYGRSHAAERETDEAYSVSPQFSSLKKSRSGRQLLPALDFWRNHMAVYDMERKLTCIKFRSS